ncbi:hypothetical protein [Streptomyces sp. NPDC000618]|uniref:hypothetical protein n=1 Tax=Streptomyces sp. NPDC000618 TaxID=3154265 RepID=UPI003317970F
MTENGTVDIFAPGSGARAYGPYPYRVRGRVRSGVVLWLAGRDDELDRVFALPAETGAGPQMPLFVTVRQARAYASRRGRGPDPFEPGVLELARVQHWLEDPARRKLPPGAVLDAWNFFEDLARGLDAPHELPHQEKPHNSAYEKLFGGESAEWTPAEQGAVLELLTAGVELWNSCPVVVNPRSRNRADSRSEIALRAGVNPGARALRGGPD